MAGRPKKIQLKPIANLIENIKDMHDTTKIENTSGEEISIAKVVEGVFTESKDYEVTDNTISFTEQGKDKIKECTKNGDMLGAQQIILKAYQDANAKPVDKLMEKYLEKVNEPSDINELLPFIYEIALECETCVEFGVRKPTSTYAFLAAHPNRLVSYDIGRYDAEVTEVEQLCAEVGQDFQFVLADVLQIEIEECDCALFDTFHTYSQLSKELFLHAPKIKKYMMFHDTISFRYNGQPWTPGVADFMNCGRGIYPAIEDFLKENPQWELYREYDFNNGMIILKNMINEKTFYND